MPSRFRFRFSPYSISSIPLPPPPPPPPPPPSSLLHLLIPPPPPPLNLLPPPINPQFHQLHHTIKKIFFYTLPTLHPTTLPLHSIPLNKFFTHLNTLNNTFNSQLYSYIHSFITPHLLQPPFPTYFLILQNIFTFIYLLLNTPLPTHPTNYSPFLPLLQQLHNNILSFYHYFQIIN